MSQYDHRLRLRVEDEIGLISPLCAHLRMSAALEHGLKSTCRIQARAYFMRQDLEVAKAAADVKFAGRPRHASSCSNQNVLHPEGAYTGVEECGCYRPTEASP